MNNTKNQNKLPSITQTRTPPLTFTPPITGVYNYLCIGDKHCINIEHISSFLRTHISPGHKPAIVIKVAGIVEATLIGNENDLDAMFIGLTKKEIRRIYVKYDDCNGGYEL